jgi:hypothetical protein
LILDAEERITFVKYGDKILSSITYDVENKVVSFIETIGSTSYTITITYDGVGDVTSITRV